MPLSVDKSPRLPIFSETFRSALDSGCLGLSIYYTLEGGSSQIDEDVWLTARTDRGEGANHAILDVLDFAETVGSKLSGNNNSFADLRAVLDIYEDAVVSRARPGVLASRRACMDAHDWPKISLTSPLLSKREMKLQFDEE